MKWVVVVGYNIRVAEYSYKDETFDLVLLLDVIEYLFDTDRLLFEVKRGLKPGGIAVISTPNLASWYNRLFLLFGW